MKITNFKHIINCILVSFLATLSFSCSKMDSTYVDFTKKGSIVYVGTPDSIQVFSGKNRLNIRWKLSDLSAATAKVYWNNRTDSLILPITATEASPKMSFWMTNLDEGSYSIDIQLFDKKGNRSVQSHVVGKVYGDNYAATLLPRPVKDAIYQNGEVPIDWGTADEAVIATELNYKDKFGVTQVLRVPVDINTTTLKDYDVIANPTFSYRTLYVPDSMAIDTFYSVSQSVKITGPPIEYSTTAWVASNEDYDIPGSRPPRLLFDNNVNTIYHMDKTRPYPHIVTVDMGVQNLLTGFTYTQRSNLDGSVKLVEIRVSTDNVIWKSMGTFTFENLKSKQYLNLLDPVTCRHFKIIFLSDYKNSSATALAELGVFKR